MSGISYFVRVLKTKCSVENTYEDTLLFHPMNKSNNLRGQYKGRSWSKRQFWDAESMTTMSDCSWMQIVNGLSDS